MLVNISKQIIDQKIGKIMNDNPDYFPGDDEERRKSKCFLLLGVSAYLDRDITEAMSFITDGGNDGGFDAAFMSAVQKVTTPWPKTRILSICNSLTY